MRAGLIHDSDCNEVLFCGTVESDGLHVQTLNRSLESSRTAAEPKVILVHTGSATRLRLKDIREILRRVQACRTCVRARVRVVSFRYTFPRCCRRQFIKITL